MPRLLRPGQFARRPIGPALAAGLCLVASAAQAQTTGAIPGSVVAPDTDPAAVSRFQVWRPPGQAAPARDTAAQSSGARTAQSANTTSGNLLNPPQSGAGLTGFNSSNLSKRKPKAGARTNAGSRPQAGARGFVPTGSQPGLQSSSQPSSQSAAQAGTRAASPARELVPLGPVVSYGPIGRRPQDRADTAFASAAGRPGTPPYELGPIYTQPKKRKVNPDEDPYAPLGIRSGGLLYYPAVEFSVGSDSNPSQAPDGSRATTYSVAPELRVQSEWSRHEFKADLRGSYTAFSPDTTPSVSRPYFNGRVDGRIDVTHQTRIELGARLLASTDNPGSPNLSAGLSRLPIYTTAGASVGVTHNFNRLEIGLRGDFDRTSYQDSHLTNGTTASNKTRDYNQYGGALRAGYEYFPGVKPFVEVGLDTRRHDVVPDVDGFNRNSKGLTAKAGTTFEMARLLTGEVALGYTRRTYDDAQLAPVSGLIGNASLVWTASGLTTVKLTAATTVGESTVADVSGVFYRDVGIQIDHAFRRWLIGTVKAGFGQDTYTSSAATPDRRDQRYSVGVGLTYKLNRMAQVKGEIRRDWLTSNVSGVDYTADIFLLGLRLQY